MLPILKEENQQLLTKLIAHDWSIPEYKIKHFVAGSHIHPLHKIKQYLMELNARQESVEGFSDDVIKLQIEIELENERKKDCLYQAEIKLIDLEISKKERILRITKEKLRNATIERDKFFKMIDIFNKSSEGSNSKGTLYMNILLEDPEECERIEKDYWEYRLAKQAAMDMIAYGRIGVGNMEAIMQLDTDSQTKCLAMAYEVVILNETRMNNISDKVHTLLSSGQMLSDISQLINLDFTNSALQLQDKETSNVPLIQKC